ncbi:hypothetical protein ACFOEK_06205 [Litoribrevibacter euphylliae]|uniref:Uncharacterized protein n=1 Tax=Litoribrevibacter euphylliae TaxID=1834034 RepID=A0ABV7HD41_9GAMM
MEANYWQYYLSFEEDIDRLFRYIEPSEHNFSVYSVELTRLYLAICSEIDVLLKAYCTLLDADSNPSKINEYAEVIILSKRTLFSETVNLQRFGISMTPFAKWEQRSTPIWWKKHNGVKHNRDINFKDANLGNVLNSFAALYVLNLYYYHELNSIELRKQGFFETLEETAVSLKSRLDVLRIDSAWLGILGS